MFKPRCFGRNEKMGIIEKLFYSHHYDNDTDMIIRTGFSPLLIFIVIGVSLVFLGIFS